MKNYLKMIIAIVIIGAEHNLYAQTCPTIAQIHRETFNSWKLYDLDNGTPLSKDRIDDYSKTIRQFGLAAYYQDAPEGAAMCYYKDDTGDQSYHHAYLAKAGLKPDLTHGKWQKTTNSDYECHGSLYSCAFVAG